MNQDWPTRRLGDVVTCLDAFRKPVKAADRVTGPFPYYGASGVIDYVDSYLLDGVYALVAEDGENLRTRTTPIAFLATGKIWVNNHAHILDGGPETDVRFLALAVQNADVSGYLTGSTQPKLTQSALLSIRLAWPPLAEQRAIAEVFGALDDKIEANHRARTIGRMLAMAEFSYWCEQEGSIARVAELASSIARGIAPKYVDGDSGTAVRVLNQKCIRDGWVTPDLGRWMHPRSVKPERLAQHGDVLVNSTGVGTLGRAGRWIRATPIHVDGHVSIVRPDSAVYPPSILGYALLAAQSDIEALAEGSTGQTELGRDRLGSLKVEVPRSDNIASLASLLDESDSLADSLMDESRVLQHLRDSLLPKLMSGELRVGEAEGLVEEAV